MIVTIILFGFSLCCLGFFLYIFIKFAFTMILPYFFWGAFYAKSSDEKIQIMIKLADLKPGQKAADLGAGNGKIIIALAQKGILAHGYEINPWLVWLAKKKIRKAGLENKAFMHCLNFWDTNLADFDAIFIYGISFIMPRLEKKLIKELKPGTRVVSHYFCFPNFKPIQEQDHVLCYQKSP